ncbi:hypothetical protein A3I25_00675 [Candidatus Nomurabacteria bacterium RIFCSPLOWO2_02_FULL_42_17]|uniref:Uncharacterized protein n=1 Tax=Candidatus Nomurabacteria bacterium RIFCSPLOWO2_02_FULL_42_17 TaxID=1801789 RepID=A0A1F6XPW8_9BACT|nr:MAG: hypothetical protein UV08_C0002G0019 [Parcubacteria group bacterium GW2011_GWA2_42_18]OGI96142.1 MAG: hypothetical protein A3I25_00675 [Candidatus Nomurabacteria bacterium RIFCSPLOWO2_02_FULL_42_17]
MKQPKFFKSFFLLFFFPILILFLNNCSGVKSEKYDDFEKSKRDYTKSHAGTPKEKEAIRGMILFSENFEEAKDCWDVSAKAKLLEEQKRAIKKMKEFASTDEEKTQLQKAEKDYEENLKED